MKRIEWLVLVVVAALVVSLGAYADGRRRAKTVTGTSSCGGCTGRGRRVLPAADRQRWRTLGAQGRQREFQGRFQSAFRRQNDDRLPSWEPQPPRRPMTEAITKK